MLISNRMPIWSNVTLILPVLLFALVEKSKVSTSTFPVETNKRKGILMREKIICWKEYYILVVVALVVVVVVVVLVVAVVILVDVETTKRLIAIDRQSIWITITCCWCCLWCASSALCRAWTSGLCDKCCALVLDLLVVDVVSDVLVVLSVVPEWVN